LDNTSTSGFLQEQVNTNKRELWNMSIRDLFYKYVRFLPLFILSVAFALLIAYLYLRYTVPQFNVVGSMLIRMEQPGGRGDRFNEIFGNNEGVSIQNEIEILRSRPLMERVVDSLNLQFEYSAKGKIKSLNVYNQGPFLVHPIELTNPSQTFVLNVKFSNDHEFRVNDESKLLTFGQTYKNRFGSFVFVKNMGGGVSKEYNVTYRPTSEAASIYAGALSVGSKTVGTGILLIAMRTTNPVMGADIVNKLMEEYSRYSVEQKNKTSDQKLEFIDNRMTDYGKKLDSTQQILLRYQQQNNLIDPESQLGMYFNNLSETDKIINEQTLRRDASDYIARYLSDKRNEFTRSVVPSALGLEDPTLNQLVIEYNKAQLSRKSLIDGNVPPGNPQIVELDGMIERLRTNIQENLKNVRGSINETVATTMKKGESSQSQLRALPLKTKEFLEIKRQVEIFADLYKLMQQEREQTAISRSAIVSNSNIINRAYPTNVPVKPNRRAIQILAIVLGLGVPALIIFLGEILNDKVTTRFDIEKITTAPILGEIGHSYSNSVLVVNKTTRSMVAEQFRIIRSNLQYVLNKKEKSTILVTSSFSGEGKSYITTNMGAVLALAGKKTVILEFDIRKPKLLSGLGIPKGPGITNYLIGKANLPDIIRPIPDQENLFVIGCGPVPPNPAELLLESKVEEMFAWLKDNFDVVIVDTAPVGMVSDAMTLSKFADSTLYIVRQGHTFKKQVALIDEFYNENKLPKVSIIINDVKLKPGYGYYGYGRYGYGYGYGYGSYYEEETAPRNFFERALASLDIRRFFRKKRKR
jgi:tyrosine-protein kinase Etk/Wzc